VLKIVEHNPYNEEIFETTLHSTSQQKWSSPSTTRAEIPKTLTAEC